LEIRNKKAIIDSNRLCNKHRNTSTQPCEKPSNCFLLWKKNNYNWMFIILYRMASTCRFKLL